MPENTYELTVAKNLKSGDLALFVLGHILEATSRIPDVYEHFAKTSIYVDKSLAEFLGMGIEQDPADFKKHISVKRKYLESVVKGLKALEEQIKNE